MLSATVLNIPAFVVFPCVAVSKLLGRLLEGCFLHTKRPGFLAVRNWFAGCGNVVWPAPPCTVVEHEAFFKPV